VTKDQEDTRCWVEAMLTACEGRPCKMSPMSLNEVTGVATFLVLDGRGSGQFVQIHPNGKPAWDGEEGDKHA
jgi:hypothetical protein